MLDIDIKAELVVAGNSAVITPLVGYRFSHAVSLGSHCYSSAVLKRLGLKRYSAPFDWMFTDVPMVTECINTNFVNFLTKTYYRPVMLQGRVEYKHEFYATHWNTNFTHYDPLSIEGYEYMKRCVQRFRDLMESDEPKFFLFTAPVHPHEPELYIPKFVELVAAIEATTTNSTVIGITTFATDHEPGFFKIHQVSRSHLLNFRARSTLSGIQFHDPADDIMFDEFIMSLTTNADHLGIQ